MDRIITGTHSKTANDRKIILLLTTRFKHQSCNPYKTSAQNTCEASPPKCRTPSEDGHHWPKRVRVVFYYYKYCCTCWNSILILFICYRVQWLMTLSIINSVRSQEYTHTIGLQITSACIN